MSHTLQIYTHIMIIVKYIIRPFIHSCLYSVCIIGIHCASTSLHVVVCRYHASCYCE